MGCFSYLCKVCGEQAVSDTVNGVEVMDHVKMWRLEGGLVKESMQGKYNSYGAVESDDGETLDWKKDWGDCVEDHFNPYKGTGFALIHTRCLTKGCETVPTQISKDDPDQGWVSEEEYYE